MGKVTLESVRKVYPSGFEAVSRFDLDVADSEFIVLVGPSGCGKSTTLRMIAGLEPVTEGRIQIAGRDVTNVHPKDRDVAMVFQSYALYPHMNARANMEFGLKIRKTPKDEIARRVSEAAALLGIVDLLDKKPATMSGGQRQRVALGRAIVREPQVFLFDEPLSNLDAKLRSKMRVELKRLHQRLRATMIYVTHDQVEAMTLGDRIVIMSDGKVEQIATPMEAYLKPASVFVAGFIGRNKMNIFPGSVDGGSVRWLAGEIAKVEGPDRGNLVIGLRPENVRLSREQSGSGVNGTIDVIEELGDELVLSILVGTELIAASAPASSGFYRGEEIFISADPAHLHFFDSGTTKRLEL
ncbi:MAG: sn-glycerol-3-phosphate ABC transporter ATP-binding protein UgpC [Planctomycetes bacterium]|nr:sn-glycerol-3-phosphate ABC transporter ATP-binding protein UgpC [Planctomycetota bacterium]